MAEIDNLYFLDKHNVPRLYRGVLYQQIQPGETVDFASIGRIVCDVLALGTIHEETVELTFAHLNDGLPDKWLDALQEATDRHQSGYRFTMLLRAAGPQNGFYQRYMEVIHRFRPAEYHELAVHPEPIRRGKLTSEMSILIDTHEIPTVSIEAQTENGLYEHTFQIPNTSRRLS